MNRALVACLTTVAACATVAAGRDAFPATRLAIVTLLDGDPLQGTLVSITPQAVKLTRGGVPVSIDGRQVLRVEFAPAPPSVLPQERGAAILSDGSCLPCDKITVDGRQAVVQLPDAFSAGESRELEIALSHVRSLRLRAAGAHQAAWSRLNETSNASDLLVVYRKQATTIDGVECTVESVQPDAVRVLLDGEAIDVPADRVFGVVFASLAGESATLESTAVVEGPGELLLGCKAFSLDPHQRLHIDSPLGFTLSLPVDQLSQIDLSAGRLRWLSELPLIEHRWEPYYGFPTGLSEEDRPAGMVVNRSFAGEPLRVIDASEYPRPGSIQSFEQGVALRSHSEAVFDLPAGFAWFHATAGIEPETAAEGTIELRLFADEELVYEHVVDGAQPVAVRAPLHGAKRLKIVVGYGDNLDRGDNLHLGAARVTK